MNDMKMRQVLYAWIAVCMIFQTACASDVITHDSKQLPAEARRFLEMHFADVQVSHIKIESELFRTVEYEVLLTNRTEISFDRDGRWLEIDCDEMPVPAALVPGYVVAYLENIFPDTFVVKMERKHREMEVDLSNDWSVTFNEAGEAIAVDD